MKSNPKILIIIRRSSGDVFISSIVVEKLKKKFPEGKIDILVNADTLEIAKTLKDIENILVYDYEWRKGEFIFRIKKELELFKNIWRKYDIGISLTANDRSNLYAILGSSISLGFIENEGRKNWWKKILLNHSYLFRNMDEHIVEKNLRLIKFLGIDTNTITLKANYSLNIKENILRLLKENSIKNFIIFHPTAQYIFKVYPKHLRDNLLERLNTLDIPIVITGGKNKIDYLISKEIPKFKNVFNLMGKTTLEEFIALCDLSIGYIGMDTLNTHISAALDKKVFAIYASQDYIWFPWSNIAQRHNNKPISRYGNITVFQADLPCVPCGQKGCKNNGEFSECLHKISPDEIFEEIKKMIYQSSNSLPLFDGGGLGWGDEKTFRRTSNNYISVIVIAPVGHTLKQVSQKTHSDA